MIQDSQTVMAATTALMGLSTDECNELLKWHDNNKSLLNNIGSIGLYNPWLHTKIRDIDLKDSSIKIENAVRGSPWNRDFAKTFPNLIEKFNELPFIYIHKIIILETIKECVPHIDGSASSHNDKTVEPYGYRMLLRTPSKSKGFYVQAIPTEEFGMGPRKEMHSPYPKQYYKPELGKWWVLNNWCCQHGSDWEEGDNKVLISVIGIPSLKHTELLKSLTNIIKHPDYTK